MTRRSQCFTISSACLLGALSGWPGSAQAEGFSSSQGIWSGKTATGSDLTLQDLRLVILSEYGELNFGGRFKNPSPQGSVQCNYVFRLGPDVTAPQDLHLVPAPVTPGSSRSSSSACSQKASLLFNRGKNESVELRLEMGGYKLTIAGERVFGSASYDHKSYSSLRDATNILGISLATSRESFTATALNAGADYEHQAARDELPYSGDGWAYEVLYARKPPSDQGVDTDSIAAVFPARPADTPVEPTAHPLVVMRTTYLDPASSVTHPALARSLVEKYGAASQDQDQRSTRTMNWVFDRQGKAVSGAQCGSLSKDFRSNLDLNFRLANGRDLSRTINPGSACSLGIDVRIEYDGSNGVVKMMSTTLYDHGLVRYDAWRKFDITNNGKVGKVFGEIETAGQNSVPL